MIWLLLVQLIAHPPPPVPTLVATEGGNLPTIIRWVEVAPTRKAAQEWIYRIDIPDLQINGKPVKQILKGVACEDRLTPLVPEPFNCQAPFPPLVTQTGRYEIVLTVAYNETAEESKRSIPIFIQIPVKK